MTRPRLVVFAGRPGSGKTTLARQVSQALGAVYIRIDTIEEGLMRSQLDAHDLKDAGYTVAQALAKDTLGAGQSVVADAVHGHQQGRDDWEALAKAVRTSVDWIHVICSDLATHERRIRRRAAEGAQRGADWPEISKRKLEPVPPHWFELDTAHATIETCVGAVLRHLE